MEGDDDDVRRARGLATLAYTLDGWSSGDLEPLMVAIADTPMILLGESTSHPLLCRDMARSAWLLIRALWHRSHD